jgi:hypothetical protein
LFFLFSFLFGFSSVFLRASVTPWPFPSTNKKPTNQFLLAVGLKQLSIWFVLSCLARPRQSLRPYNSSNNNQLASGLESSCPQDTPADLAAAIRGARIHKKDRRS